MTNSTLKREILLALAEAEEYAANRLSIKFESDISIAETASLKAAKLREIASRIQDEQEQQ